jgi:ATP-dependent DNA helicase PIF1
MESLNEKQKLALEAMINGENIFITGPGGSGKSHVVNIFIQYFREQLLDEDQQLFVTSSTGLSSLLIHGITIHQYSGLGSASKNLDFYVDRVKKNKNIRNRWRKTKTLIIDEISMISEEFFEKLDLLGQKIRRNQLPFGGIQLILSGDFLQLPPVKSNGFCFESFSWDLSIDKTIYFDKIIRQKDKNLQKILNKVRVGVIDEEVKKILDTCLNRKLENKHGIKPTLLFSRKDMVNEYNNEKLQELVELGKETKIYQSSFQFGKQVTEESEDFLKDLINNQYSIDDHLTLTKGTQVMLNANNIYEGLANGSRGIIIDFSNDGYPIVHFLNDVIVEIKYKDYKIEDNSDSVVKKQIPLIHAWAITIHKAQGMSLEYLETDIGNSIFEYGQAYVVLSRIKNLEGLSLLNIDYTKIKANPKIIDYYKSIK